MLENSEARTADWIGRVQGAVIYAYDVALAAKTDRSQDVMTSTQNSAASVLLTLAPPRDLIGDYASAATRIFRPYTGPDEDLGFDPNARS